MNQNIKISVISPVFEAHDIVTQLVSRITEEIEKIGVDFEIVLVDDGSSDTSWAVIKNLCTQNATVKGIKLSRNFGQHYAITAGLKECRGEFIIVMDCDLQDDPKYIPEMYTKAKNGFDIVYSLKGKRKHNFIKNIFAVIFDRIFNWLSGNQQLYNTRMGSYTLIKRKVADAFCNFHDYHRHYLMVLRWLGFSHTHIEIEHQTRQSGKSSYTFSKLMQHAVNGITSQSDKLLRISIAVGFIFFLLSITGIIVLVTLYFLQGFKEGWPSLVALILLSTGLILMSLGILGIYLGKTYEQTKNRPLYIIDEKLNF